MGKEAYYFPHFSNARNDRKILRIRKELGIEGYGIYFMLLEVLREQSEFKYPLDDLDLLADSFNTSEQKVRTVICNYKLFDIDDEFFFSPKMLEYLQPYFKMKAQRIEAAAKSVEARKIKKLQDKSNDRQNDQSNDRQTTVKQSKVNESKVKERKEKEVKEKEIATSFKKPTTQEVETHISEMGYNVDAKRFVNFYEAKGWMIGKNKMKNWKAAVSTWNKNSAPKSKTKTVWIDGVEYGA